ncbi:hypothetical protein C4D60_Mb01t25540 [Musa balbisiana]|uniref:Uncharacterized protein n=1 Tax=Musa balbisiana TaxID=52838 RepID=A0A4S8JPT7_MUSBA|nr:hypothetical protein C4D60_Mb01t25540 [Musa balbisiana]
MECYFCHHPIGVSMFTEKELKAQLAVFISPAPRKGEWWGRMAPVISVGTKLVWDLAWIPLLPLTNMSASRKAVANHKGRKRQRQRQQKKKSYG